MKNKKTLIIWILILLSIAFLFLYVTSKNDNLDISFFTEENSSEEDNKSSGEKIIINNEEIAFNIVDDHNVFFKVNEQINTYYDYVENQNASKIIAVMDKSYVTTQNITESNVLDKLNNQYQNLDFYSNKIYYKTFANKTYYFVYGDLERYLFAQETSDLIDNYLLVINDNNSNAFSIVPLENIDNFENYIKNYNDLNNKEITRNTSNQISSVSYNDERIIKYYINYYRSLIFLNPSKAYQMLSNQMLKQYASLSDFENDLNKIYTLLSSNILGYSHKNNVYSSQMNNLHYITFNEESIMNFKVTIIENNQ